MQRHGGCSNQRRLQQGAGPTSHGTVCAACCSTQQTPACNTCLLDAAFPFMGHIRAKSGQQPGSRLHCVGEGPTDTTSSAAVCPDRWTRCRGASCQLLLQAHRVALEAQGITPTHACVIVAEQCVCCTVVRTKGTTAPHSCCHSCVPTDTPIPPNPVLFTPANRAPVNLTGMQRAAEAEASHLMHALIMRVGAAAVSTYTGSVSSPLCIVHSTTSQPPYSTVWCSKGSPAHTICTNKRC